MHRGGAVPGAVSGGQEEPHRAGLRAFLRLEIYCFTAGVSWVDAKTAIIRAAVRKYLEQPRYRLPKPATAQHLFVTDPKCRTVTPRGAAGGCSARAVAVPSHWFDRSSSESAAA